MKKQKRSLSRQNRQGPTEEVTKRGKNMANKINITFQCFTLRRPSVTSIITKCIDATLKEENISVDCEINVLVTDDKGIHAINLASREIDKPTDVLSFPMFDLTAGAPPTDWEPYMDIETDLCPLGDMCISSALCL